MAITRGQCRAARALLEWTQDQLAETASVAKKTLADFEAGKRTPYDRTLLISRKPWRKPAYNSLPRTAEALEYVSKTGLGIEAMRTIAALLVTLASLSAQAQDRVALPLRSYGGFISRPLLHGVQAALGIAEWS